MVKKGVEGRQYLEEGYKKIPSNVISNSFRACRQQQQQHRQLIDGEKNWKSEKSRP